MSKTLHTQGLPDMVVNNVDTDVGDSIVTVRGHQTPRPTLREPSRVECKWPRYEDKNDHLMWLHALETWWRTNEAKSSMVLTAESPIIVTLHGLRPYRLTQLDRIFWSPLLENEKLELNRHRDALLILTFDYFTESQLPVPEHA